MPTACTIFRGTHTYMPRKELIDHSHRRSAMPYSFKPMTPGTNNQRTTLLSQCSDNEELRHHHSMVPIHTTNSRDIVFRQWGAIHAMARPIPCPMMVSSRIPVSKILPSPYFILRAAETLVHISNMPKVFAKSNHFSVSVQMTSSKYLFNISKPFTMSAASSANSAFTSSTFNRTFRSFVIKIMNCKCFIFF